MSRLLGQVQSLLASTCMIACAAAPSLAQPGSPAGSPDDGGMHQWSTVNLSGNAPYMGNPGNLPAFGIERDLLLGRGTVAAPFRISRTELTHGQYIQFLNALNSNPATVAALYQRQQQISLPLDISGDVPPGMTISPSRPDGTRTISLRDPGWTNVPVQVTWRMAALYCNWMHNERSNTFESFMTGAYNAYSWSNIFVPGGAVFTDDAARMPGARFFIPNLDESIAAAHYDPNRYGPNQGGYWLYGNRTDSAPVYGQPGEVINGQPVTATTPGGIFTPTNVGSIPEQQSPWGLWDSVGGWGEWTGSLPYQVNGLSDARVARGDRIDGAGWANVYDLQNRTLRIGSIIPSPSIALTLGAFGVLSVARRRR